MSQTTEAPKRRRGHPGVPQEKRLSRVYTVRFTEGEWAELLNRVESLGLSKQQVIRLPLQNSSH